jgi:hypothetical protein
MQVTCARVLPWSDDASAPFYGVDVVARQRVARRSCELIPHAFTSDSRHGWRGFACNGS